MPRNSSSTLQLSSSRQSWAAKPFGSPATSLAASPAPQLDDPATWTVSAVIDSVDNVLPKDRSVAEILRENDVDGHVLLQLTDSNLKDDLGIRSFGTRLKIRELIDELKKHSAGLCGTPLGKRPANASSEEPSQGKTKRQKSEDGELVTVQRPAYSDASVGPAGIKGVDPALELDIDSMVQRLDASAARERSMSIHDRKPFVFSSTGRVPKLAFESAYGPEDPGSSNRSSHDGERTKTAQATCGRSRSSTAGDTSAAPPASQHVDWFTEPRGSPERAPVAPMMAFPNPSMNETPKKTETATAKLQLKRESPPLKIKQESPRSSPQRSPEKQQTKREKPLKDKDKYFERGQLVLSKMSKYPPWPAIILSEELLPEALTRMPPKGGRYPFVHYQTHYPVLYLGAWSYAWSHVDSTTTLTQELIDAGPPKEKKTKGFRAAYRRAKNGFSLDDLRRVLSEGLPTVETEDEDEEYIEYEVERITDVKIENGVRLYCVYWVGYENPTWEPRGCLDGCGEKLAEFEKDWTEAYWQNKA